jgi:hypothetical protein
MLTSEEIKIVWYLFELARRAGAAGRGAIVSTTSFNNPGSISSIGTFSLSGGGLFITVPPPGGKIIINGQGSITNTSGMTQTVQLEAFVMGIGGVSNSFLVPVTLAPGQQEAVSVNFQTNELPAGTWSIDLLCQAPLGAQVNAPSMVAMVSTA